MKFNVLLIRHLKWFGSFYRFKFFLCFSKTDGYLDQDALYQAVSENVDQISDELNVTVGDVEKGEVEATSPSSGGLASWAIAVIVVVVLLVIVLIVLGVIYVYMKKAKK